MEEYSGKKIYEKIVQYSDLTNGTVLEIGCGNGRISALLSEVSGSLIAIDPDKKTIERAKKEIIGVDFRIGSGENLDFPDHFFNIVIFTLSLHHQNSRKALSEAARVLISGGKILVIEPVVEGEIEKVFAFLHNENEEKRAAQNSIINSGLPIIDCETFTAEWVFRDKDDLFCSLFQYYNMPFNAEISQNISTFLCEKINSKPIVLSDTMIIQSLIKGKNDIEL